MIIGRVDSLQAKVNLTFRFREQANLVLEFVVDTGFEGALTLPPDIIEALDIPFVQEMSANLADDSSVKTNIHAATIIWNGDVIDVAVLAMGRRPLLGTALLEKMRLGINFEENGVVTIENI